MDSAIIVAGLLIIVVVFTYRYFLKKAHGAKYPPGPLGLPGLGSMLSLSPNPSLTYMDFARKYGSVFSIQMGWRDWVIINDYESAREALVKQGEAFAGRPDLLVTSQISEGLGIILIDYGTKWKKMRKFGLMTLTGFGLGKTSLEERIHEEAGFLIDVLGERPGSSVNCHEPLTNAVSNIICSIVMGSRFSYNDERFRDIVSRLRRSFSDNIDARLLALMTLIPSFRFLPLFKQAYNRQFEDLYAIFNALRQIVQEHKDTFRKEALRDFIDAYIQEMDMDSDHNIFTDRQLFHYVRDLFIAGTDTTSNSLRWSLLSLMKWPDFQEKIHQEIDDVIGDERPSMRHREHMPFTCAWLQEVLRHRPLLPLMAPRKTCEDVKLHGHHIPKDTAVMVNIWAIHYNKRDFENPSEFRPQRFIDSQGNYISCDRVIPFSIGPRHCLGRQLVKMEMFIFLTSILQVYQIKPDPKRPAPSFDSGVFGLTYVPHQFNAIFEKRSTTVSWKF